MSAAWLGLSAATQRCRMGTGAESLPLPSSHIHPLTATLEGVGQSSTRVNKKSTDFRAKGVEPSRLEVKAVRTTALQAGATIRPCRRLVLEVHMWPFWWVCGGPRRFSSHFPDDMRRGASFHRCLLRSSCFVEVSVQVICTLLIRLSPHY